MQIFRVRVKEQDGDVFYTNAFILKSKIKETASCFQIADNVECIIVDDEKIMSCGKIFQYIRLDR